MTDIQLVQDRAYVLPHRIKRIRDQLLLVTDLGDWIFLDKYTYTRIIRYEFDDMLLNSMENALVVLTRKNAEEMIRRYYARYFFLEQEPSLHIIELTNACNHRCIYCHAEADCRPEEIRYLKSENIDKILDFIFGLKRKNMSIEFQGGEPTLNFDVIIELIMKIRKREKEDKKDIELNIVTNLAMITDAQIALLVENGCNICTSIDGPAEVHDVNRPLVGEMNSHEKVIGRIRDIKRTYGKDVGMLLTVTRNSLPYWKEIVDQYVALGAKVIQLKKADIIGDAKKNEDNLNMPVDDYIAFWKMSLDYMIELNKRGVTIFERSVSIIMKKLTGQPTIFSELQSPCGMVTGQMAYSTEGKIYSCDFARGRELFEVGDAGRDDFKSIMSREDTRRLISMGINEDAACDVCAYQAYCGLCPVLTHSETGNPMGKVPLTEKCQTMKKIFDYIFDALSDPEKRDIILGWAGWS
ncbi:MAG: His-Xaa-Ser system radical SAM maturase HxsB [Candidatus Woesearchaeota archaeon]